MITLNKKKKNQLHVICVFWCLYILSSFDIPIFFQNILFTIISNKHASYMFM